MAPISEDIYREPLRRLAALCESTADSPMFARAKIDALILLNMRYESIQLDRDLKVHPYSLTASFIEDSIRFLSAWREIAWVEDPEQNTPYSGKSSHLEEKHKGLFQDLWVNFSSEDYNERISRYIHRLKVNGLFDDFLHGKRCIDFGCGHGNFAHALVRAGASYVLGIDFGEKSIAYAKNAAVALKESRVEFMLSSVYEVPVQENSFDFAVQNGVFHHLEDEDRAIKEMSRVLKSQGWMWYYTDGSGGISNHLWDSTIHMLRNIPHTVIVEQLKNLNLSVGKRYHLGDGLNATYRHTTWDEITNRLSSFGFGNFRRLVGGFPTDFDHDVIAADKYGVEKFGSGELRLLAQKL